MRVWYAVWAGVLALACGSSADDLFEGTGDASAGTGGSSGRAGSGGSGGSGASGGTGGSASGGGGAGGEAGAATLDGAASDASESDGALGSGGSSDGGGSDGGVAGGVGIGGPGQVVCGDQACPLNTQQCCLGFPIFGCQSRFPPVCIVSAQLNCDDALDCNNNQTCCATVGTNGRLTSANCQNTCDNGTVVCNDSTRCPTGTTCKPVSGMQNYRTCVK